MLISVVIPVYNRPQELARAIRSVLSQTFQEFEILVVDDFSEADLKPVTESFHDQRLRYFRLPAKGNANVCRNKGIREAHGELVAMLDSDDEWLPQHLENKIKTLREKNADGVFGSCYVDDGTGRTEKISRPLFKEEKMINFLLSGGVAPTPTHVYKTSCARQVLWDEDLKRHQDWDFSVRFADRFSFVCDPSITCVVHWKKGEKRSEHAPSLIRFIESQRKDIQPGLYIRYYTMLYPSLSYSNDPSGELRRHCRSALRRMVSHMSLVDYLSAFGAGAGPAKRLLLRLDFLRRVLKK